MVQRTKGIPSVPDVPAQLTEDDIYRILEPLKRIIDIRQGRFDPLDRWVTQQDLIDAGLQQEGAVESPVIVVPSTQQYPFDLVGDINGGPVTLGTGNPTTMSTIINLPNVTEIFGGDAAETFPAQQQGPYGVAGGGGGGSGVPDGGTTGQLLTKLSDTDGDADWRDPGSADTATLLYYPNYTSYTRVDNDTFTIDLVNAEALFRPGRRVRFEQGGAFTFGVVTSVDFNVSNANDTTVNLTMEGADTIPTGTFDVALTTSGTAWSPIVEDPFSGTKIYDIATGAIGGTQWWVIVGENGRIYTSTDGGVTWTQQTSGDTGTIYGVCYDDTNEQFYAVGVNGAGTDYYFRRSTDGTTWTDLSGNSALPAHASGDFFDRIYWNRGNYLNISYFDSSSGTYNLILSNNEWVSNNQARGTSRRNAVCHAVEDGNANAYWARAGLNTLGYYTSFGDPSPSNLSANSGNIDSASYFYLASAPAADAYFFTGDSVGHINIERLGGGQIRDSTLGSNVIRAFAHSQLHDRIVAVGDSGQIAYIDEADVNTVDSWTSVANGLAPLANFTGVAFNESDGVFVAVADNGQILRSSNGTN